MHNILVMIQYKRVKLKLRYNEWSRGSVIIWGHVITDLDYKQHDDDEGRGSGEDAEQEQERAAAV